MTPPEHEESETSEDESALVRGQFTVANIASGSNVPDCKSKTGRTLQQLLIKELCDKVTEYGDKSQNQSFEIEGIKETVLKIKSDFEQESKRLHEVLMKAQDTEEKIKDIM